MAFTLNIKTSNDAFGEDDYARASELGRILRELADGFSEDGMSIESGRLLDYNGNVVGEYSHTVG